MTIHFIFCHCWFFFFFFFSSYLKLNRQDDEKLPILVFCRDTLCNFVLTEFTSSSGQVSNERAASGNWSDEFCLPDDVDTLSQTLSPVIYTVIGGTGMLGVLLLTYACYRCHNRSLRVQHARYLATLPSPPQFPTGAAYIYRDDLRIILVNQN